MPRLALTELHSVRPGITVPSSAGVTPAVTTAQVQSREYSERFRPKLRCQESSRGNIVFLSGGIIHRLKTEAAAWHKLWAVNAGHGSDPIGVLELSQDRRDLPWSDQIIQNGDVNV